MSSLAAAAASPGFPAAPRHLSPRTTRPRRGRVMAPLLTSLISLAVATSGCDRSDLIEVVGQIRPWQGGSAPNPVSVPFTVFTDDVGDKASVERRVLFKTREAYEGYFGHRVPATVDFTREWAIFYAAGTKRSGGYAASIVSLATYAVGNERLLAGVTRLESPGAGCAVTDALTAPHVLIKFAAPSAVFNVDFTRTDSTRDCGGEPANPCAAILCGPGTTCVVSLSQPPQGACVPIVNPCDTVRCAKGTHCEAQQVQCVRAPCPPIAQCVPDGPAVRCGGFAGLVCPGVGSCVDDPSDSCDPMQGGADCGGLCVCSTPKSPCGAGKRFDAAPGVCACVPAKQ